ncbi:MAG: FAD:protein FMN transferase [Xanthomonadales bacterium]|nr:FAD:protein FMN transferase [Xanthomonadales bacterium]
MRTCPPLLPGRPRALFLLALLALAACRGGEVGTWRHGGATMGTTWSVQAQLPPGLDRAALAAALQAELDRVIAQLSTWEPDSDISRYNRAPAGTWQPLPEPFNDLLAQALALAEATAGAYDPTVGPLVALWGFGAAAPRSTPPSDAEIAAARQRIGWQRLRHEPGSGRVLQPGGVMLDLVSIAEGHAVDRLGETMERHGVADYLVEIGGELRARGRRPDGRPWQVAVVDPLGGPPVAIVALRDASIATSGDYLAHFEHQGVRYGHAIDPHSGWPVRHGLASVTVLAEDSTRAGALATALSVLGPDAGLAFAQRQDIAALLLVRDTVPGPLKPIATPAWRTQVEAARQGDH